MTVVPYVVYTFAPFIVPRNLEAALPFASIVAAATLVDGAGLLKDIGLHRLLSGVLVALSLTVGAWMSWRLTSAKSGFAASASYARSHGQSRVLSTSEDMVFYFPGGNGVCDAPALPQKYSAMKWYVESGYRYVIIERHRSGVGDFVRAHSPLAASFVLTGPLDIGENLINSENTHPPNASDPPDVVSVYDVHELKLPRWVRTSTRPKPCTREIVT
jgi:hypothetical protein